MLISKDIQLTPHYEKELLGGITVLHGSAHSYSSPIDIRLIPYYAWSNRGISSMRVWLKTYRESNQAPTAAFTTSKVSGIAPLVVLFDASTSSDADGDLLSYLWDFGDGATSDKKKPAHKYMWEGNYIVTLIVDDQFDGKDTTSTEIIVTLNADRRVTIADFEFPPAETQGFEDANWFPGCLVDFSRIDDPTGRSLGVVSMTCDASKSDRAVIRIQNLDPGSAPILGCYIYLPADFPDPGLISVWGDDNVGGWRWNSTDYHGYEFPKETWVPVFFYMEKVHQQNPTLFNPYGGNYLDQAGIHFYFGDNKSWAGTIYIDDFALLASDTVATKVATQQHLFPLKTQLYANYPNPFNPSTTISFDVDKQSKVSLIVYNMMGQKIKTLVNGPKQKGRYQINWDGTDDKGLKVSSGLYFCVLKAGEYHSFKKMIMMK